MTKVINFDIDGTIANLYGVEGWLDYLMNEDVKPYRDASVLLNMNSLARILNRLMRQGYEVNVVSWLCKGGSEEYNERVTETKKEWLNKHLHSVKFTNLYIVPYGTPKHNISNGILFDDEEKNRKGWGEGAYDVHNILEVLKSL